MKLAIMQPYFMPYIGYFQLINAVDQFVIYDNIKYTKKGWINRNRILLNGHEKKLSLPLKSDSDFLNIVDRSLSDEFSPNKLMAQIAGAYHKAPYFQQVFPLLEKILMFEDRNLFKFNLNSIKRVCDYLKINTRFIVSSTIDFDNDLKSQDKVIDICKSLKATVYINPIGGLNLYSGTDFAVNGIDLRFLKSKPFIYTQFDNDFVPWLSIIDVLMFNDIDRIHEVIEQGWEYE